MANELQFNDAALTGATLYVVVWNEAGQAWNGSAFATYTTTRADFDIAAIEISGTGFWQATFPGTAGYRRWAWYLRAGGSPSHSDDVKLLEGSGYWDGTNLVSQGTLAGDVGGKVLGGGSGTITGTGVRADNRDGQDIAAVGDAMALTSGERGTLAAVIEAVMVQDGDATALLQAIADKFTTEFDIEDLTLAAIASAVWNRLLALGFAADSVGEQFQQLLQGAATTADLAEIADGVDDANSAIALVSDDVTLVKGKTDQLDFTGVGGALRSESTNMRGTDNALLAASYTAPLTAQQTRDSMKLARSAGAPATDSIDQLIEDVEGGSGGEPASFDNTDVVEAYVTKLGTRRDGVVVAYPALEFVQGEVMPFWIDCKALCGDRNLRDVTNVQTSDESLEIVSFGLNNKKAVIWIDTSGVEPGSYVVQCKVHPWQNKEVIAQQPITINAPLVSGGS